MAKRGRPRVEPTVCPHCNFVSKRKQYMEQHHGDNCRNNVTDKQKIEKVLCSCGKYYNIEYMRRHLRICKG